MKPIPQISQNQRSSRRDNRARRGNGTVLPTDYYYRPTAETQLSSSAGRPAEELKDRKSTRLNSSHRTISYAVFCLKKKMEYRCHGVALSIVAALRHS